jgi:dolichol-phosphate mannosyltransferase
MSPATGLRNGRGVLVVLPTYNERQNLEPMLEAIIHHIPEGEVLVVDDNSPDGTGTLADRVAALDGRVHVLHRPGKEGLGRAYQAGFDVALHQPEVHTVVQMDCDFSHDPADIARLLAVLDGGVDLAIGSRYVSGGSTPGWSLLRRMISRGGSLFARTVLGLPYRDLTGGFKAWRASTLAQLNVGSMHANGYGFQIETTWRAHGAAARIVELPITFRDRLAGKSKMSPAIMREALLLVLRLRLAPRRTGPAPNRMAAVAAGAAGVYPASAAARSAAEAWPSHSGDPSLPVDPSTSTPRYSHADAGAPQTEQGRLPMSDSDAKRREVTS